jgi:hypothetical protein
VKLTPVVSSRLVRETSTAYWYRCVLWDGRSVTITVPKKESDAHAR